MVRLKDIQAALIGLVGWKQNFDTSEFSIYDELTKSDTGYYFQQEHPLLTLDNIKSIAPNFSAMTFSPFVPGTPYKKGNIVTYGGKKYKALKDNKDIDISDVDTWKEVDLFSEWLLDKTMLSIGKVISRFCNEKVNKGTLKILCENKTLFDGTGRIVDTETNRSRLVGFEIVPVRAKGVTTKINKIGLQFTKPGTYKLYLMHSSQAEPIRVIELEKTKANSLEWFSIDDLYLPYESENNDAGGSWYLCYAQDELPAESNAIIKHFDWSKGPCSSCSRKEYESWKAWSRYNEVHPFYVQDNLFEITDSLQLWDIENNIYDYSTNYGINLDLTVQCDITDFIISQRHIFKDVISKQAAVDMLREFVYNSNVRTNRHSINASRTEILYELDGDSASLKKSGLAYQLDLAFEAISLSTEGIDRVCMPCKNNGIRYRTI